MTDEKNLQARADGYQSGLDELRARYGVRLIAVVVKVFNGEADNYVADLRLQQIEGWQPPDDENQKDGIEVDI